MNSIERVISTFRMESVDRFPIFEQAVSGEIVSKILGRKSLGFMTDLHFEEAKALFSGDNAYKDFVGRFKEDFSAFINKFDPDIIASPWFLWEKPSERIDEFTFKYENEFSWQIRKYDPDSKTFSLMESSWDFADSDQIKNYVRTLIRNKGNGTLPEKYFNILDWMIEKYGKQKCVAGASAISAPLQANWLLFMLEEPECFADYIKILTEGELQLARAQIQRGIKIINGGGDLATNKGSVYSPEIFKNIMLPQIKRIIDFYHDSGAFYIFRTDGNVWEISDDLLVNSGTDAYGEIDIDAGMDFIKLRNRFPQLILWGGLSCGSLLVNGTDDEITAKANELCSFFAEKRGWIAGSSNSVLHKTNLSGYLKAIELIKNFKM